MSVVEHHPATTEHSAAELRGVAETAARIAGDHLRTVFRGDMVVDYKRNRHDLVTEHDRAAEDLIVDYLLGYCPDWSIVGEEAGVRGGDSDITWYVDPIDGTSNFAQGLAFFCVALGVEVAGELVAGVVYDPMADRMFSADDAGAYLDGAPLLTPGTQPHGAATMITGYPTADDLVRDGRDDALAGFGALVESFSSVRRTGSGALTLAHVAAGWTDAAFGGSVNPWDVAGGSLIVRRAGGSYRPLWFGDDDGRPDHLAPGFVAAGPDANYPALDAFVDRIRLRRS